MMPLLRGAASPPSIARRPPSETMSDDREQHTDSWLSLVLRDAQFWVPVAVLVAGLLVLRWIS